MNNEKRQVLRRIYELLKEKLGVDAIANNHKAYDVEELWILSKIADMAEIYDGD